MSASSGKSVKSEGVCVGAEPVSARRRVRLVTAGEEVLEAAGWPKGQPAGDLLGIEVGGLLQGFVAVGRGAEARVGAVWLRPEARRSGFGVEAVRSLVTELRREGCSKVHAFAPAEAGLFVYFWFRLGFRPDPGRAGPEGMGLIRDLAQ